MKTKVHLYLGIVLSVLYTGGEVAAQSEVALATRAAKLQALSEKLQNRDFNDRQQAQEWAGRMGINVRLELPSGSVMELQRLLPGVGPMFYTTFNLGAADTVSTDDVWPGGSAGLALDGSGVTVGEWDAGAVYASHPDYFGRLNQRDSPASISGHSTHVAGTLVGSGSGRADATGMAPAAYLDAYDWNSDTSEMAAAAAAGLLVSNHSYGIAAGWVNIGNAPPNNWWWFGGLTSNEDGNFGYYDAETQYWDQIAFDAPYYLIVKAAGNDRWDVGPDPGEVYTIVDQGGASLGTSTDPRPADCGQTGYDCLPTTSVAKNILTVGAVEDLPGGYSPLVGSSQVEMAGFSSWGPTDDGRIKPDVVGNGVLLLSTYHLEPDYYALGLGTSMAAPNVTGSLLLLQEHYQEVNGSGNFMRAATLKALVIHTADETGNAAGPDYEYGWGLLNTEVAAHVISDEGDGSHWILEGSLAPGATDTIQINAGDASNDITATIVWTDPPGSPVLPPTLNPPDSVLVNDLDLRISEGLSTYLPWVLNPAAPASPATKGDNVRDNVEQVVINGVGTGTYIVKVSHKGALLNSDDQAYALIISAKPSTPTSSGVIIDEDFSGGLPAGWSVDTLRGVNWTINAPVQGSSRLDNHTGGSGKFAIVDNAPGGNYSRTLTSLQTQPLDLSSSAGAILKFRSYFISDWFETINVDVSTSGGSAWSNVWSWLGPNFLPTQYQLDLSNQIAGHTNVLIRFRFDSASDIQGNTWQIDDIELDSLGGAPPPPAELPGQATNPGPSDGSSGVEVNSILSWSAGSLANTHDVYVGTNDILDASHSQGNQTGTSYDPGTLNYSTTYYWRIDEVNGDGITQGNTWSFATEPDPGSGPVSLHVGDLDADRNEQSRNRWQAVVNILVHNQDDQPLAAATVSGDWGAGSNGSGSCVTSGGGQCAIAKGNLKAGVSSVSFTVTSVTSGGGQSYVAGDNHDPDGDSDGVSINIPRQPGSGNTAPTASIVSPENSATYNSAETISFSGSANDSEEGNLSGSLVWNSDRDGGIGSGASFFTTLSDGNHTITAAVTDSEGASDTDSIAITVGSTPVVEVRVTSLQDTSEAAPRNRWNARVAVSVLDASDQVVSGAVVTGTWSDGAKGSAQCTTASDGRCTLTKGNLKSNVPSIFFTVDGISGSGVSYTPGEPAPAIQLLRPF